MAADPLTAHFNLARERQIKVPAASASGGLGAYVDYGDANEPRKGAGLSVSLTTQPVHAGDVWLDGERLEHEVVVAADEHLVRVRLPREPRRERHEELDAGRADLECRAAPAHVALARLGEAVAGVDEHVAGREAQRRVLVVRVRDAHDADAAVGDWRRRRNAVLLQCRSGAAVEVQELGDGRTLGRGEAGDVVDGTLLGQCPGELGAEGFHCFLKASWSPNFRM